MFKPIQRLVYLDPEIDTTNHEDHAHYLWPDLMSNLRPDRGIN